MKLGEVLFFDGRLIHRSGKNTSTEPRYSLAVDDPQHLATMAFFLVIALVSSNQARRLRAQIDATRTAAKRTTILYDFSRKIAGAATRDDVLWAVVHHVAVTIQGRSLVLLPREGGGLAVAAGYSGRNNELASSSTSIESRRQSLEPSTSSERGLVSSQLALSWNVLDFGVSYIRALQASDRVLIAEACTHHPIGEDIGRVKIPRWLRQFAGCELDIVTVAGHDLPADLESYRLAIHCGGCVMTRQEMLNRMGEAERHAGRQQHWPEREYRPVHHHPLRPGPRPARTRGSRRSTSPRYIAAAPEATWMRQPRSSRLSSWGTRG